MSVITKTREAMEPGSELTIDFVSQLISEVKTSSIPGKAQLLHDLGKTLDAIKLANRLRRPSPKFQPGTTVFIAANKVFVSAIDGETQEESVN